MDAERFRRVRALFERLRHQPRSEWEQALTEPGEASEVVAKVRSLLERRDELVSVTHGELRGEGSAVADLLARLTTPLAHHERFAVKDEFARGGMGVILRVWDQDLRRHLAMKVMLEETAARPTRIARFLEEAQVTGQLDHPGIVPVHELGIDGNGRVFFTMKLVKGITLAQVFTAVETGTDGWNRTRALSVVLRVCEAMAFAHDKGVIHRDLKPSNIMVGKFGETYVMDWGLARVLAESDAKDIRIRPDQTGSIVRTDRREDGGRTDGTSHSPLVTMDGDQIGTPCYMPPEQAQGDLERIGPQSDVYAAGAILYHLLARRMPYVEPGTNPSPQAILAMALHAAPEPVHALVKDIPAELLAICEKAMARRLDQRYRSMTELADDLRAYLERRVVKAYETGALAEMKKWVVRNRGLATAAAVALAVTIGGLGAVSWLQTQRRTEVEAEKALVVAKSAEVSARKAEFDQLAGKVYLERALATEADLYPPWPEKIEAFETWLANDWRRLDMLRPTLRATIADLEARAEPSTDDVSKRRTWRFADGAEGESQRFLHETLSGLAADIDTLELHEKAEVSQRLDWARKIGELTLHHPNARATWDEARSAIAKADGVVAATLYREMPIDLKPQVGLVPIGMNPMTLLWEFYELRSAWDPEMGDDPATIEIPAHRDDGSIDVHDGTGIVFVLIPGGTFWQGAQPVDESQPNFDPGADLDETPERVTLAPYFLARHEITRGQWKRLTSVGTAIAMQNSDYYPGDPIAVGWTHPVESVTWDDCDRWMGRHGLALPTEARWEYGARGMTNTIWWTGTDPSSLSGAANVLDRKAEKYYPGWGRQLGDFDDGFTGIAPVGSLRANAFGLFNVHGNVWEWCADAYASRYRNPQSGDGLRRLDPGVTGFPVNRGGSYVNAATLARSADRRRYEPSFRSANLGIRAARDCRD